MKKYLFSLIIIALILLSACSQENLEVNDTNQGEDIKDPVAQLIEQEPIIQEPEELTDYDTEDLLVEKRINEYDYEDSKTTTKALEGVIFDSYEATYSFNDGDTEAKAAVLMSDKVNVFDFIDKLDESDEIEFLEQEDYDFLDADIYFNPYENMYIWISGGKIIIVEKTIGFNVLERYIDEYPISVISEEYESGEDIVIKLTEDEGQKIILIEDDQYVLELDDLSENNQKAKFLINDEQLYIKVNEEGIVSGLLIELNKVTDDYIEIEIKKQVIDSIELEVFVDEEKSFKLNSETNIIELINQDAESRQALVNFNGERYLLERDETESIGGINVKLDEVFDLGTNDEENFARFIIWID